MPSGAWFPPLVEALIAASILYMALENIAAAEPARRWLVTCLFGLVHGFGFSFLLQSQLQFAGSHLLLSLLAFNVGIELGQLLVLAIVIPVLGWVLRFGRISERALTLFLSLVVGHTAWHWMTDRFEALGKVEWPEPDVLLNAAVYGVAVVVLIAVGYHLLKRRVLSSAVGARPATAALQGSSAGSNPRDLWL